MVGNITAQSTDDGTITRYTYDQANKVTSAAWKGGSCPLAGSANTALPSGCVKFGYDTNGRLALQLYPGNVTNTITRDKAGRVTGINAAKGGATVVNLLKQTYGYATAAGADRANVQTMVDNTGDFTPAGVKQTYAYDSRNRLTSVWEHTTAGTQNAGWSYSYDKNGNRLAAGSSGQQGNITPGVRTFTYNAADQLATINGSTAGIGFDANGDETASPGWLPGGVAGRTNVKTSNTGDVAQWTRPDTSQVFNFTNQQVLPTGTRNLTWAHDLDVAWARPARPRTRRRTASAR